MRQKKKKARHAQPHASSASILLTACLLGGTTDLYAAILFNPVKGFPLTSPFSERYHPIHHAWRPHKGVDFGVPEGTRVYAANGGMVENHYDQGGFGYYIRVTDTGSGISTLYAHLSRVLISSGPVQAGTLIALSGNSGGSTAPHLHFEVRYNGQLTDPLNYLNAPGAATMARLGAARNLEFVQKTGQALPPYFSASITISGGQSGIVSAPTMAQPNLADQLDLADPLANNQQGAAGEMGIMALILAIVVIFTLTILFGVPILAKVSANLLLRAGSTAARQMAKAGQGIGSK